MPDKIILTGCRFFTRIGCIEEERLRPQEILFDIEITTDISVSAKTDDINDALDYRVVHESVKKIVENNTFMLIETLIESISASILGHPLAQKVLVRLHKPRAMEKKDVIMTTIEIVRSKL